MTKSTLAPWAAIVPPVVRELLGSPPLVLTESEEVYWGTVASFAQFVGSTDPIAWLLIKDVADARVEIHRYRKFKSELIDEARRAEIAGPRDSSLVEDRFGPVLAALGFGTDPEETKRAADAAVAEEAARQKARSEELATTDGDLARVLSGWIEPVQQIDRLLIAAEARYAAALDALKQYDPQSLARVPQGEVIEGEVVKTPMLAPARNRRRGRAIGPWTPGAFPRPRRKTAGKVA
jgi:hypothetical protein